MSATALAEAKVDRAVADARAFLDANVVGELSLLAVGGSRAYGTDHPDSDVDLRGFYVAPARRLLSGLPVAEQYQRHDPDLKVYEAAKLVKLAAAGNPNALEIVFAPQLLHTTDAGQLLVDERQLLLSRACYDAYAGFAKSQVKHLRNGTGGSTVKRHKFLLHAFRLLETCERLFSTGELHVAHPDPQRLHDQADVDDETAFVHFDRLLARLDVAVEASLLPERVDRDRLASLLYRVRETAEPQLTQLP